MLSALQVRSVRPCGIHIDPGFLQERGVPAQEFIGTPDAIHRRPHLVRTRKRSKDPRQVWRAEIYKASYCAALFFFQDAPFVNHDKTMVIKTNGYKGLF